MTTKEPAPKQKAKTRPKTRAFPCVLITIALTTTGACAGKEKTTPPAPQETPPMPPADAPVYIPDHFLAATLMKTLGTSNAQIRPSQLMTITTINARKRGIIELEGIQHCKNLQSLDLAENHIHDISPLKTLKNLRELNLEGNYIQDVSPLAGLTAMRKLDLARNRITSITPVANMKHLRFLDVSSNQILSIECLSGLTALSELHIDNNNIADLGPLATNCQCGGLGQGDVVFIKNNPFDRQTVFSHIPFIQGSGVKVIR